MGARATEGCVEDETVAAYVTRELEARESARVESHLATCTECRQRISALAKVMTGDEVPTSEPGSSSADSTTERSLELEAMQHEGVLRRAAFGRAIAILAGIGLSISALPFLHIPNRAAIAVPTGLVGAAGLFAWWSARANHPHTKPVGRFLGLVCVVAALALVAAVGPLSPIVVILGLGIAFFGSGHDVRVSLPAFILVIVAFVITASLYIVGGLHDRSGWSTAGRPGQAAMATIVTAVLVAHVVIGRANDRARSAAQARLADAMRELQARKAQLEEERHERKLLLGWQDGRLTEALIGPWRVGEIVGQGAMGEVYAVRSEVDGRAAAMKVLRSPEDAEIAPRFLREAEIALRVRGPNLVEVFETGRTPDGSAYILMELLVGRDLAAVLRDRTSMPLEEVAVLVDQAARGLEVLHQAGVIHRDLKPQNLFCVDETPPRWKILDYGVSKLADSRTLTKDQIVGTPAYMAPEQAEGKDVDARADVFSLAAIAYRALTGQRPFSGRDTLQILYQVIHGAPLRPRDILPTIPESVETVLALGLAKKPGDRIASAAAFAEALRAAIQGKSPPLTTPIRGAWSTLG
jgi:serine/threonine-protein kinase